MARLVWDPQSFDGFDVSIDLSRMLRRYYATLLSLRGELREVAPNFAAFDIGDGFTFSVDKSVLQQVRDLGNNLDAYRFLENFRARRQDFVNEQERGEYVQVGPDDLHIEAPSNYQEFMADLRDDLK